ncbi:Hypothetical protein I5071_20730 [Sandaracinus amylolyticus]|nr:Hypothetical protein I5071_20730 [Sandaracinus amylolyticus]
MGDRLDRFRSRVRDAAASAREALGNTPFARARDVLRELRDRRARIPERQLARAVLRAGTVSAASVRTRDGRIEITAELESGRAIAAALIPESARFAPRGAKEIVFAVDPPEAASDAKLRDVAGMIAALVARAVWGPFLPPTEGGIDAGAMVDREGEKLRVDLRTCPAVRAASQSAPAAALVMDALVIERFDVDEQGLSVRLGLPKMPVG